MICHSESPKAVSESYDTKRHKMLNPKTSFLFQHDRLNAFTHSEVEISDGRRVRVTEPSPVSEDKEPTKPKACRRNYPSTKNFRLISAFTLAEVLITLGIIGVVAALTIPNLIQESRNKELVSGYLKMHNTLSNGLKEMEAVEQMSFYKWGESDFKTKFEEHLKTTGCNANDGNFNPNVCLTDGSFFKYGTYDSECSTNDVCMELTIDTNGKKNPNQAGKDQFTLLLTKSGVKALGENESCSEGLDCGAYVLANHKLWEGTKIKSTSTSNAPNIVSCSSIDFSGSGFLPNENDNCYPADDKCEGYLHGKDFNLCFQKKDKNINTGDKCTIEDAEVTVYRGKGFSNYRICKNGQWGDIETSAW